MHFERIRATNQLAGEIQLTRSYRVGGFSVAKKRAVDAQR